MKLVAEAEDAQVNSSSWWDEEAARVTREMEPIVDPTARYYLVSSSREKNARRQVYLLEEGEEQLLRLLSEPGWTAWKLNIMPVLAEFNIEESLEDARELLQTRVLIKSWSSVRLPAEKL